MAAEFIRDIAQIAVGQLDALDACEQECECHSLGVAVCELVVCRIRIQQASPVLREVVEANTSPLQQLPHLVSQHTTQPRRGAREFLWPARRYRLPPEEVADQGADLAIADSQCNASGLDVAN